MLPSNFYFGDEVVVNLGVAGNFMGIVAGINFTESQVNYDIKVIPLADEPNNGNAEPILFRNIRSFYIETPTARFAKLKGQSNVGLKIKLN